VSTRLLLVYLGVAIALVPGAAASERATSGTIVFASTRAAAFVRPALYTIGVDGRARRRVTPTLAGLAGPVWSPSGRWIAFEQDGRRTYAVPAHGGRPVRVARRFATSTPTWSPDGSRLALVAEGGERQDLLVADAGTWKARRLARSTFSRPAWSPDARSVAFVRENGTIRAVDVTTGRERTLLRPRLPAREISWSPDGRRIAISYSLPAVGIYEIYVADLQTGVQRRVARNMVEPAWSPDGRRIAAKSGSFVYVMDRDGRHKIRLGRDDYDETPDHPPVWSPDGRRLAIANGEVYAVWANGRGRVRVTRETPRFRLPWLDEASWSPDGKRVAYVSQLREPGDNDLYALPAAGGRPRALTNNWAEEETPVWSPDGRLIALTRMQGRQPWVAVLRPGGKSRLLMRGREPAWSPDGGQLAFTRAGDIYIASSSGTGERPVTFGPDLDASPDWSPDGRELVFSREVAAAGQDLWAIAPDGSGLRRLTNVQLGRDRCTIVRASSPAWSPDGAEIAFSLLEGGNVACLIRGGVYSIHVVAADGSGRTRYVTDGGPRDPLNLDGAQLPAWSPDGSALAFVSSIEEQGPERIAVVPRAGGRFRFVTPGTYAASHPDWRLP
jgi:Tol biopolymer transport system component